MNQLDLSAAHSAAAALDQARSGAGITLGYDGVYDAFGGSYWPGAFRGIAGLVKLYNALAKITDHAWHTIHKASDRVRKVRDMGLPGGWVVQYQHGSTWVCLDGKEFAVPRRFDAHRVAATVAGRMRSRYSLTRVVSGDKIEAEKVAYVVEQVRVAVRTMLAARPLYDELVRLGAIEPYGSSILAGYSEHGIHCTGLRWLAGATRETDAPSVDQARAFAEGAGVEVFAA